MAARPGPVVPLEIEILPSGTLFRPGETLRLVVQGRDVYRYPRPLIQAWHDDTVNRGRHIIYAGGEYDSHLLVPCCRIQQRLNYHLSDNSINETSQQVY